MSEEKIKELAAHEIGWWQAHHRKRKEDFLFHMTQLYKLQFRISEEKAKRAVEWRIKAADWHDKAEYYKDKGEQERANKLWEKAEKCLQEHFKILIS